MKTDLRLALRKPHWRYKLSWLVLSLVVALGGYAFGLTGSQPALALSRLALCFAALAGAVMAWYALLVMAGRGARARVPGRSGSGSDRADKIGVWIFSAAALPVVSYVGAWVFAVDIGATVLPTAGVLAFFAVMRTMDVTRDSCLHAFTGVSCGGLDDRGNRTFDPALPEMHKSVFEHELYDDNLTTILGQLNDPRND